MARHTGLELYKNDLFFSLDAVQVTPEECQQLLRQLPVVQQMLARRCSRLSPAVTPLPVLQLKLLQMQLLTRLHNQVWPCCLTLALLLSLSNFC